MIAAAWLDRLLELAVRPVAFAWELGRRASMPGTFAVAGRPGRGRGRRRVDGSRRSSIPTANLQRHDPLPIVRRIPESRAHGRRTAAS